jgi:hypothetical protein
MLEACWGDVSHPWMWGTAGQIAIQAVETVALFNDKIHLL